MTKLLLHSVRGSGLLASEPGKMWTTKALQTEADVDDSFAQAMSKFYRGNFQL